MVACIQLLVGSNSAGKPIFKNCNVGRYSRELFIYFNSKGKFKNFYDSIRNAVDYPTSKIKLQFF